MARKKKEFPPVKERFIGFRVTEELYEIIENEGGTVTNQLRQELTQCITDLRHIREDVKEMAGEYRGNH